MSSTPATVPPSLWTQRQVASYLRVDVRTVFNLVARGELPCVKIFRVKRFDPADVQAFKMLKLGGSECIWFCDPSNPEGIRELSKHDVRVNEAVNAILFGIDAVNSLIEGERLFVSDRLKEFLDIVAGYAYDVDGLKPVKINDHLPDAFRYLVASVVSKNLMEMASAKAA